MHLPTHVKIVEVGPRDGLQNEPAILPTAIKVTLIEKLASAGCGYIEAASFVSPKWVPQMADGAEVLHQILRKPGVTYAALTPNLKGFEAALAAKADEVAIFASASESFSQKNINCSIADSLDRFKPVMTAAHAAAIPVRGYVSCIAGCPYEGAIAPDAVRRVSVSLYEMGCREISLGDTIGVARPAQVEAVLKALTPDIPLQHLAGHFHDSYGMAIVNVYAALQMGMSVFDSSIAGLGGCPYAKGATGNVATEDVVWLLQGLNIETGIDLSQLINCGQWISDILQRPTASRTAKAMSGTSS